MQIRNRILDIAGVDVKLEATDKELEDSFLEIDTSQNGRIEFNELCSYAIEHIVTAEAFAEDLTIPPEEYEDEDHRDENVGFQNEVSNLSFVSTVQVVNAADAAVVQEDISAKDVVDTVVVQEDISAKDVVDTVVVQEDISTKDIVDISAINATEEKSVNE